MLKLATVTLEQFQCAVIVHFHWDYNVIRRVFLPTHKPSSHPKVQQD